MLYPQNGDSFLTMDSVTSLQPVYEGVVLFVVRRRISRVDNDVRGREGISRSRLPTFQHVSYGLARYRHISRTDRRPPANNRRIHGRQSADENDPGCHLYVRVGSQRSSGAGSPGGDLYSRWTVRDQGFWPRVGGVRGRTAVRTAVLQTSHHQRLRGELR